MLKKKIVISLLAGTIILGMNTISNADVEGKITGETVKLRDGASLQSNLVTLLSVNDKVNVLSQEGDWYKVEFKDKTGYVNKNYIKLNGTLENVQENSTDKTEEAQKVETPNESDNNASDDTSEDMKNEEYTTPTQKITSDDIEVKILPLINSSVISTIKKDTKVMVTEYINGWVYINAENTSGWIRSEKLSDINQEEPAKKDVDINKQEEPAKEDTEKSKQEDIKKEENKSSVTIKKAYVNVEQTVNVRKQPNTSSEVITNLSRNDEVTVISEENNWCKVKVDGKEGYIAKKYLSDKKLEITNRSMETERTKNEDTTSTANSKENSDTNNNVILNSNETKGSEVVAYAKQFLGVRYISGGTTPSGFDCSGFTSYVYKHFNYSISRTAATQAKNGREIQKSELQLGDLVIFRNSANTSIGHVGIYIGGNSFIHASSPGDVVKITSLSDSYYLKRYVTARRIL